MMDGVRNLLRALRRPTRHPDLPQLQLDPGERVLAWATDQRGTWYAGSGRGLLISTADRSLRIPWERIEHAEWDGDAELLVVVEVAEFGEAKPVHRAALYEPERLLQLVRERITASVVLERFVQVTGRRGITVVARRAPHTDEPLTWSFVVDPALDETSAEVIAAIERGFVDARAEIGE
jgi:hypothetical protein